MTTIGLLRPTLLPGLARIRRGRRTLQFGVDPRHAVVVELADEHTAAAVDLLDGTLTEQQLIARAVRRGARSGDVRALLTTLHAHGLLVAAHTLTAPAALKAETAALALRCAGRVPATHRSGPRAVANRTPAQIMRGRAEARVAVVGRGRLAAPIAIGLAGSGVGHVRADLPGEVRPEETVLGLDPTAVGRPRSAAVTAAVRRAGSRSAGPRPTPTARRVGADTGGTAVVSGGGATADEHGPVVVSGGGATADEHGPAAVSRDGAAADGPGTAAVSGGEATGHGPGPAAVPGGGAPADGPAGASAGARDSGLREPPPGPAGVRATGRGGVGDAGIRAVSAALPGARIGDGPASAGVTVASSGVRAGKGRAQLVVRVGADQPVNLATTALRQRHQAVLAVDIRDGVPVIGPFVAPGGSPCLGCLDLHRIDRDPAWPEIAAGLATAPPAEACDLVTIMAATAFAVGEVLAYLDGGTPSTAGGAVELVSPGEVRRRYWPPHPRCSCGSRSHDLGSP
ncbi:hypothetical protein AB0J74_04185 [Asanoa sp. NPDC049573]|uniref:hypothetical protein n=1 Tax=Asanoa sp. NPDC049573 TaxID=3155396 RepID=UPI00343C36F9